MLNAVNGLGLECGCSNCTGTGKVLEDTCYNSSPFQITCNKCKGTGLVPSEIGQEILDFIHKYVKLEIRR